jgi:hypothetical protein
VGSLVLQIGLVAVLVALNGIFAGNEMALVSMRESQLAQLQHRGRRGRSLAALVRRPNQLLAAAQIGVTLAHAVPTAGGCRCPSSSREVGGAVGLRMRWPPDTNRPDRSRNRGALPPASCRRDR